MAAKRIAFIDFARGYAMLLIVLFHYFQHADLSHWLQKAINLGGTGTHLFIFVSAFSLGLSLKGTGAFFKTRFFSVLVPYYLCVTFIFLFNLVVPIYARDGFGAYLGHIFLFKMFDDTILYSYGYHFWFISTLIQLYLAYPLLRLLREKAGNSLFLAGSFLVSAGYWLFLWGSGPGAKDALSVFFLQFLWEFSLGMVAADLYRKRHFVFWERNLGVSCAAAAVGIAVMGAMALKCGAAGKIFNDVPGFLGFTFLCIAIYTAADRYLAPLSRLMVGLGRFSYALFLVHMLPLAVILHALKSGGKLSVEGIFLVLPATLFLAWLYQLGLDRLTARYFVRLLRAPAFG